MGDYNTQYININDGIQQLLNKNLNVYGNQLVTIQEEKAW